MGGPGKSPKKKDSEGEAEASGEEQPQQLMPPNPSGGGSSSNGEPSKTTTPPAADASPPEEMAVETGGARDEAQPMLEEHSEVSADGLSFTFTPTGASKPITIRVPSAYKKDRAIHP